MRTIRGAARILTSRGFWRDFRAFYSSENVAAWLGGKAEELRAFNERPTVRHDEKCAIELGFNACTCSTLRERP